MHTDETRWRTIVTALSSSTVLIVLTSLIVHHVATPLPERRGAATMGNRKRHDLWSLSTTTRLGHQIIDLENESNSMVQFRKITVCPNNTNVVL